MDDLDVNHEWLACHFDHIFFESECGESSKRLVDEFYKKGTFVDSDGAIGANLRDYGLGFCLLLKRDGTVLYATRDLSLAQVKFDTYGIDRSIYVVDSAQTLHFQQVFKCLELMGYEQAHKCYHLPYAQVVLPSGKMSSRKGNVILFSELKERLLSKIRSEYLSKYENEWPQEELDQTAYAIALATIRYGMLNQDNNSLIVFDLEEWTAKTGNTGPYILYAYARIASILKEAGAPQCNTANFSLLTHPTEAEVLLHLMNYHGIVERACQQMTPMLLCVYVYQLSKLFSQMYSQCSVLKAESEELSIARVCLVDSIAKVIKHALSLIGIVTVERM
ncbi:MAG: arginine--tRNA ligase [Bdellovibrionales bacterium]|nr:arginine--tRNA ligase [Bdellovibrionales bacterium]